MDHRWSKCAALSAALAAVLCIVVPRARYIVDRYNCSRQLQSLWCALQLYKQEHGGQWPLTLKDLDISVQRLLKCPGVAECRDECREDYIYIPWQGTGLKVENGATEYPLIYDRSLSNHRGKGINILLLDGRVMWDPGAMRLKKFASEHSDIVLPVPR
jgi:hypothetical protein